MGIRTVGTRAYGIRLPIISRGDDLAEIAAKRLAEAVAQEGLKLNDNDVVGITEAIVAKAQGNYATVADIAADIKKKFGGATRLGLVFPILSRNRFLNILKGISLGAEKLTVLLCYPSDEVGNRIIDPDVFYDAEEKLADPVPAAEFLKISDGYRHPFTGVDYISVYENASPNIEVFLSRNPRDILRFTKNVIVGEIHSRFVTKKRLLKAGAENVVTLSDILSSAENGGYNEEYGVLGSNLLNETTLKLFPRDCKNFIASFREKIREISGAAPEVLIYGDGAFKDPSAGIWELADPVVSPAYTDRLGGTPNELKIKYIAENMFGGLSGEEKQRAVTEMIREKNIADADNDANLGTTPRKYADLTGSLCDLISGSGDKGTPVVLIKGYFDNYAEE